MFATDTIVSENKAEDIFNKDSSSSPEAIHGVINKEICRCGPSFLLDAPTRRCGYSLGLKTPQISSNFFSAQGSINELLPRYKQVRESRVGPECCRNDSDILLGLSHSSHTTLRITQYIAEENPVQPNWVKLSILWPGKKWYIASSAELSAQVGRCFHNSNDTKRKSSVLVPFYVFLLGQVHGLHGFP